MTKRQREVLNWLIHFIEANGYAPTLAQIGAGIGTTFQGAGGVAKSRKTRRD